MIQLGKAKVAERLTKIPLRSNGKGHMVQPDVNAIPIGYSVRTYDVNLDRPGAVSTRRGIIPLCENPAGALQIASFEPSEVWVAEAGVVSADTVNFRPADVSGIGTQGLRITDNAASGIGEAILSGLALNLGYNDDDIIGMWVYLSAPVTAITLNLYSNLVGPVRFVASFSVASRPVGWTFLAAKRSAFAMDGAPDWASITSVELAWQGTANAYVTFDNLYVGPRRVDGTYQFRQSSAAGGGNFKLVATGGTVYYLNDGLGYFIPIITGMTAGVAYTFATFADKCYVMNGYDAVRVIVGDRLGNLSAATCYLAGITAPTSVPIANEIAGMGLVPSGTHRYRIVYFSTITGKESNSIVLAVAATGANAKIRLDSLPISADPKVDWLRIYRQDDTDANYRRITADINGDAANGALSVEDITSNEELGEPLEGANDYIPNSPPPILGFATVVGNRMIGGGVKTAPGTLYASRPDTAEQWDLVHAPTRMDVNDNDSLNGVAEAFGFGLAGKDRAVYVGAPASTPSGFTWRKVESRAGFMSHRSIVVLEDGIRYRSHDGYYHMGRDWVAKKISRMWDSGPSLPGLIEPSFDDFDSTPPLVGECCGAYNKRRGQIVWTDTLVGSQVPNISPVLHVGALESTKAEEDDSPPSGWAFHRYANGNILGGLTALSNYVDDSTGKHLIMGGGPGGFLYRLDSDELSDKILSGDVMIAGDVMDPPYQIPGVAMGVHVLKDFREDRIVFTPLGNWTVGLTYYYDWSSKVGSSQSKTPVGNDLWTTSATPFTASAIDGETGTMIVVVLPARLSRNIARRVTSLGVGQPFEFSQSTYHVEYGYSEGAV